MTTKIIKEPVDITENVSMRVYMIPDYSPTESRIIYNNVNHILADGVRFWDMFVDMSDPVDYSSYPKVGMSDDTATWLFHHIMLPISIAEYAWKYLLMPVPNNPLKTQEGPDQT